MWGKLARALDEDDLKTLAVIGLILSLGVLLTVIYFRRTTPVRSLVVGGGPRAKLIERYAAERSAAAASPEERERAEDGS